MPQMAPIYWLILFTMFLLMFYLMMNLIYFSSIKSINNTNLNHFKLTMKNYNKLI